MFKSASKTNEVDVPPEFSNLQTRDILTKEGQPGDSSTTIIKEEPMEQFQHWTPVMDRSEVRFKTTPLPLSLVEAKYDSETSTSNEQYNMQRLYEFARSSLGMGDDGSNSDATEDNLTEQAEPGSSKPSDDGLLQFKCEICPKRFKLKRSLEEHFINIHVVDKEFQCSKCNRAFISQEKLDSHVLNAHERLKCRYCPKTYRLEEKLRAHLEAHEKSGDPYNYKRYKCTTCGKGFTRRDDLSLHERGHTKEKPYKCDFCPKTFAHPQYRAQHIANHHGGKKAYECHVCSKTFFRKYDLVHIHLPRHSDERNFKCGNCPASFKNSRDLKQHVVKYCRAAKEMKLNYIDESKE